MVVGFVCLQTRLHRDLLRIPAYQIGGLRSEARLQTTFDLYSAGFSYPYFGDQLAVFGRTNYDSTSWFRSTALKSLIPNISHWPLSEAPAPSLVPHLTPTCRTLKLTRSGQAKLEIMPIRHAPQAIAKGRRARCLFVRCCLVGSSRRKNLLQGILFLVDLVQKQRFEVV